LRIFHNWSRLVHFLALDGDTYPHSSYFAEGNHDLKYAYYSAWELYLSLIRKGAL